VEVKPYLHAEKCLEDLKSLVATAPSRKATCVAPDRMRTVPEDDGMDLDGFLEETGQDKAIAREIRLRKAADVLSLLYPGCDPPEIPHWALASADKSYYS
jgi:DNA-binding SARP family transcriptional activator